MLYPGSSPSRIASNLPNESSRGFLVRRSYICKNPYLPNESVQAVPIRVLADLAEAPLTYAAAGNG